MEDAVEALKLSASVLVFVIALAIVFSMFSQAKSVGDYVLNHSDNTYYDTYINPDNNYRGEGRTVGLETVIPTLYRYYREKYYIALKEENTVTQYFDEEIERGVYRKIGIADNINGADSNYVESLFKYDNKIFISWLANPNVDTQKRVTAYITGQDDIVNGTRLSKYKSNVFWPKNSNGRETFYETYKLTENGSKLYPADDGSIVYIIKGTKKVNLTYRKQY